MYSWSLIPKENRNCTCGNGIEDEKHVLNRVYKTSSIQQKSDINETSLALIFKETNAVVLYL